MKMNHRVIHKSLAKLMEKKWDEFEYNLLFFNGFKKIQREQLLKRMTDGKKLSTGKTRRKFLQSYS